MADVSPTKWHLAHTTWFVETFILPNVQKDFRPFHPGYAYLFNSYYENAGDRHPRAERGHASRPTLEEVTQYRAHVDHSLHELASSRQMLSREIREALVLARHHEEQHQELILTDIRHVLGTQPLRPAYEGNMRTGSAAGPLRWIETHPGLRTIGWTTEHSAFAFDNEAPRHQVYVPGFALASRLVTEGEYRDFIADGGYTRASLWLSDGWAAVKSRAWTLPLYWRKQDGDIRVFDFSGERALDPDRAVTCLSLYEADAFARWAGARLPTEAEWEVAIAEHQASSKAAFEQVYDTAWQWTASAYAPYPGFKPFAGDFGEYNGKFMCSQSVLRGGACTTPPDHARLTYRNFFPPDARWQTTGVRLARDSA